MNILICTDGTDSSIKAAELVTKFGFPGTSMVVLLAVSENDRDIQMLTSALDSIENNIGSRFSVTKKVRHGYPLDEILAEVIESSYDLVVVGGGGSQVGFLHSQIGSTAGKLARKLDTHFLVVRNVPSKFDKVLFCAGPDTLSSATMSVGGSWLSKTHAQIGLLHVVPPNRVGVSINSNQKAPADDELMGKFGQMLRDAGVENQVVTRIRMGVIVDEVIKEIADGNYQLLVIGAHYLAGQDLWQGTLLDDVTDQLLNRSNCSVLII